MSEAVAETETVETNQADQKRTEPLAIDLIIAKVGVGQILSESEWQDILTIDASQIRGAKDDGELAETARPRWGFAAGAVREWIRKFAIAHELTAIGKFLLTVSVADVIPAYTSYSAELFSKRFLVSVDAVRKALREGELLGPGGRACGASYIPGASLSEWVERNHVPILFPIFKIKQLALQRRLDEAERLAAEARESPPSPLEKIISAAEDIKADHFAAEQAGLSATQKAYREILLRRKNPKAGDASDLAMICDSLGPSFDREKILADCAALDRLEAIESETETLEAANSRCMEAHKLLDAEYARHKLAVLECRRARSIAVHMRESVQSRQTRINEIKNARPYL
jgi:hypothetical protein